MPCSIQDILLRLVTATLCGAVIGTERSYRNHPAGVRTFSLVCLGSAIAMVTDEYLVGIYQTGDPARLAAQVVSGVGFLGAGAIIVTGSHSVKGLSTAAVLWTTACLGIAFGSGSYGLGLIAFALIVLIMTVMSHVSHYIDDYTRQLTLSVEIDPAAGIDAVRRFAALADCRILSMEKQEKCPLTDADMVLTVKLELNKRRNHGELIDEMYRDGAFHYIEESR